MPKKDGIPDKVVCGLCLVESANEEDYLDHDCEATGYTPRDPKHFEERDKIFARLRGV